MAEEGQGLILKLGKLAMPQKGNEASGAESLFRET